VKGRKYNRKGTVLDEISAFNYELARRCFPLEQHPAYAELDRFDQDIVWKYFSHKGEPAAVMHDRWPRKSPEGFAPLLVSWNLAASDRALVVAFLIAIRDERSRRGVKSRRSTGNRNRPVSWHWLELIDDGRKLDDADRSHRSHALKKAAELKPFFVACWAEIQRFRRVRASLTVT